MVSEAYLIVLWNDIEVRWKQPLVVQTKSWTCLG